jgi:hypothetical protein
MSITNEPQVAEHFEARKAEQLRKDYEAVLGSVDTTLDRMRALPKAVESEADLDKYAIEIKAARELRKRLTDIHGNEKAAPLGEGRAVDNVFFGAIDRLEKRSSVKGAKPGAIDVCQARVDDYMQRLLMAERQKRAEEAAEAARKLKEVQDQLLAAQAAAEEAAAKAARARNLANIDAHRAEAAKQEEAARSAAVEFVRAEEFARDAFIETKAKPADLTRTRLESGSMATMVQEPFIQIDDVTKLDKELLWPHLKEEHILMALKAWAKTKSHKTPMAGATIEMRNKGGIR